MTTRCPTCRALAATLVLAALSVGGAGCKPFGGNLSLNINVPLGLNGTIGLLNPDGGAVGPGAPPPPSDDNGTIIPPDVL